MNCPMFKRRSWVPLMIFLAAASSGLAQEKRKISVEWIYSDEAQGALALPSYQWLENGKALFLDVRKPKEERTIEILDPATGQRAPLVEAAAVLRDLRKYLGDAEIPKTLPWPESFSAGGRRALYTFAGDLFILDNVRLPDHQGDRNAGRGNRGPLLAERREDRLRPGSQHLPLRHRRESRAAAHPGRY